MRKASILVASLFALLPFASLAEGDLVLSAPNNAQSITLNAGESVVLTANKSDNGEIVLVLRGVRDDQLTCERVEAPMTGSSATLGRWKCTGKQHHSDGKSDVYFGYDGTANPSSNTVSIQVVPDQTEENDHEERDEERDDENEQDEHREERQDERDEQEEDEEDDERHESPQQQTPGHRQELPPAGFEEEVITNFTAYSNPFSDTNMNNLGGKAAAELYRRAVVGGFPDGEFKGRRAVNRAEAAKFLLLARFQVVDNATNNGRFPDVLDGQWYTRFVVSAAQRGIISGHPDGLFRPGDQVNTAEFLKMLALTFDLPLNQPHSYTDVPSDSWYAPYAGIASAYDLFPGRTTTLMPEAPLTRQEVAIAIYQYLSHR